MNKILETGRIYLREMTRHDYQDLCEIMQDKDAMYAYERPFSDSEVQDWLDRQLTRYRERGFGLWAVIGKETGAFIGQVGLTIQVVEGREEMEIGYLVKRKYWHKGYATEAALACKEYAFNRLGRNRVVSIIRDTNYASQRVAERVGMRVESRFVKHYRGVDMPHFVYAVERDEEEKG